MMTRGKKVLVAFVCALCVVLAGWTLRSYFDDPYDVPDRSMFVCVATGELFDLNIDEAGMIPARNRKTSQRTLLPCVPDANGDYRVGERYRSELVRLQEVNRFVDPQTLKVTSTHEP